MTEQEVVTLSKALTGIMREVVREATEAFEHRLELVEGNATAAVAEVKASLLETLGDLRERVAVVEVREPVPGPPGPSGPPGVDGKDGMPGLRYCGVWVEGKTYDAGDLATWGGSTWHCNGTETRSKPGDESKAWTMMVKAGRDVGRDTRERGK